MSKRGLLLVVSGPSGVGKGTASKLLLSRNNNLSYSISATTRTARAGEEHGVNYYFLARGEFFDMVEQNGFLEWAEVYGNFYGTPKFAVEQMLDDGKDVVMELDAQGAMQLGELYPDGVFIFIMPPSWEELERRIVSRGSETPESLACRLSAAKQEMPLAANYDYVVINDDLVRMVEEIEQIIEKERARC